MTFHYRKRRLYFVVAMVVGVWLVVEFVSVLGHRVTSGDFFPKESIEYDLRELAEGRANVTVSPVDATGLKWGEYVEVIHPYFGFVGDPRRSPSFWQVSEDGFSQLPGKELPSDRPRPWVVGLFGGSFSFGTAYLASDVLARCAQESGRSLVIRNYAAGGYKQPQQLHILTQKLADGERFDVVLNIDGFNEVTLPPSEGAPSGVHPQYPRVRRIVPAGRCAGRCGPTHSV